MKTIVCVILCLFMAACSSPLRKETGSNKRFEIPEIPADIQTKAGKAVYLAEHYWDKFDFTDTTLIADTLTEQAFVDYIVMLPYVTPRAAEKGILTMLGMAEADSAVLVHFTELYDKYLYDPNSPYRNEELYIPVLNFILASEKVDPLLKLRPQHQLGQALKNRVGTKAADLRYTTASGRSGQMSAIDAEYTLLFFYNPDCNMCKDTEKYISASQVFGTLMADRQITVLALYPDKNMDAWKAHLSQMPKEWINGYDASAERLFNEFYDLRAIPSLYLLSKDKTVLLKDADVQTIERYLAERNFNE